VSALVRAVPARNRGSGSSHFH